MKKVAFIILALAVILPFAPSCKDEAQRPDPITGGFGGANDCLACPLGGAGGEGGAGSEVSYGGNSSVFLEFKFCCN